MCGRARGRGSDTWAELLKSLADQLGIQPQSVRARVCRTGSYYGVRPQKLPNGRLSWPDDGYERIVSASRTTTSEPTDDQAAA